MKVASKNDIAARDDNALRGAHSASRATVRKWVGAALKLITLGAAVVFASRHSAYSGEREQHRDRIAKCWAGQRANVRAGRDNPEMARACENLEHEYVAKYGG